MIGEAIYIRVSDRKQNLIATKRGNVLTHSWRSKSAVFRMNSALTSHGYSKSIKAVRRQRNLLMSHPMPKTSLHIFDHTVKPILLYCSEIWGCYLPKSTDFNFMFDYSRLSSVLPCDKLHIHFCKYILGANKTSTNFAILNELGRIPFALDCFTSVFK